jgi:hypothetical protein
MITKSLEKRFLKYMYEAHVAKFGHGKRDLQRSKLIITAGPGIEQEIPEILVMSDGMKKYLVADVASELELQGLVQFSNDKSWFWLTDAGYESAAQGLIKRCLSFLNENAGLSIPIALLSLVVSIAAFFFSVKQ